MIKADEHMWAKICISLCILDKAERIKSFRGFFFATFPKSKFFGEKNYIYEALQMDAVQLSQS